jgi:formylglycine-generating enzyme required for sulfatase activity
MVATQDIASAKSALTQLASRDALLLSSEQHVRGVLSDAGVASRALIHALGVLAADQVLWAWSDKREGVLEDAQRSLRSVGFENALLLEAIREVLVGGAKSADSRRQPTNRRVVTSDGTLWVYCPPGAFVMGSRFDDPLAQSEEQPCVVRTVSSGFWMMSAPVTEGAYQRVNRGVLLGNRGNHALPVTSVSFHDAQLFCAKLASELGLGGKIRLPTEVEWEYACRAGDPNAESSLRLDAVWSAETSDGKLQPVCLSMPNAWGLYDMLGNVWEWADSGYTNYGGVASENTVRILRGGSHLNSGRAWLRPAARRWESPRKTFPDVGFRVVCDGGEHGLG